MKAAKPHRVEQMHSGVYTCYLSIFSGFYTDAFAQMQLSFPGFCLQTLKMINWRAKRSLTENKANNLDSVLSALVGQSSETRLYWNMLIYEKGLKQYASVFLMLL